jgi:hypothetical protein
MALYEANIGDGQMKNQVILGRIAGVVCAAMTIIAGLASGVQPVQAGASGSFSSMSFPGCDIRLEGGTVDAGGGMAHIRITSGSVVLTDKSKPIPSGSITSYTIGFADFAKPEKSSISVRVDVDGTVIADLSGDYPGPCINLDLTNFPSYMRDGRVDPKAGDRLAIWCNKDPRTVDVWGVGNDSIGFPLATFTQKDLAAAGPDGVTRVVRNRGAVSAAMDDQGNLWIAWNGGPFGANGRDSFGKALNCHFPQ